MNFRPVALFLITSVCAAQNPAPPAANAQPDTIFVAPGTSIPLSLVNAIKSKSSRRGDSVRSVVAFPVTVGTQVAIPAGTYVEGTIDSITPAPPHGMGRSVKVHFTRLLFSNGYSPSFDALSTDAMLAIPDAGAGATLEIADIRAGAPFLGEGFAPALRQTAPTPPPLPQVGPSKAVVIGCSVGAMAGLTAILFAVAHHRANSTDFVVYDSGWQFAMVLTQPLILDALRVKEATALPAPR